jgi:hypothetical protein
MAKRNQHVIPLGNGWAVKGEGNTRYTAYPICGNNANIH